MEDAPRSQHEDVTEHAGLFQREVQFLMFDRENFERHCTEGAHLEWLFLPKIYCFVLQPTEAVIAVAIECWRRSIRNTTIGKWLFMFNRFPRNGEAHRTGQTNICSCIRVFFLEVYGFVLLSAYLQLMGDLCAGFGGAWQPRME